MTRARSVFPDKSSSAQFGFEAKLWLTTNKLRNNMDAAVTERSDKRRQQPESYKHAVPKLIFLKYIADSYMVALPGQLFYSTQIPVYLRFVQWSKGVQFGSLMT